MGTITAFFQSFSTLATTLRDLQITIAEQTKAIKLANQNEWLNKHGSLIIRVKRAKSDAERWVMLHELQSASQDFPEL